MEARNHDTKITMRVQKGQCPQDLITTAALSLAHPRRSSQGAVHARLRASNLRAFMPKMICGWLTSGLIRQVTFEYLDVASTLWSCACQSPDEVLVGRILPTQYYGLATALHNAMHLAWVGACKFLGEDVEVLILFG